jgi:large subunit ribosomal protein L21
MYAVIETGGKQHRVSLGDVITIEKLAGEKGSEINLGKVLAVVNDSGEMVVGAAAASASVKGTIVDQDREQKVLVFKFKRKKQYKRTIGHRQWSTDVKISEIVA